MVNDIATIMSLSILWLASVRVATSIADWSKYKSGKKRTAADLTELAVSIIGVGAVIGAILVGLT